MRQFDARRYDTARPVRVRIEGDRIAAVDPLASNGASDDSLPWVAPALFDLQINGFGGTWFADEDLTPERVLDVLQAFFAHGLARLCPTLITNSFEHLVAGFETVRRACEMEPWADRMVAGCHLEGPYIAVEDGPRGAHPADCVRPCDWNEFTRLQDASGNRIRLVTLAPESPGAPEFIRRASQSGVVVSIGHTAANTEQIAVAVAAGATLSTHLGNGAHGMIRRHPNYIWDQLAESRLAASLITDGHHLPASVVRAVFLVKGPTQTIITCDASGLAGCPPGTYEYLGGKFEVLAGGPIVIAGQRQLLAGSGQLTDHCVQTAAAMADIPLAVAWDMASRNPARLLGLEIGELAAGSRGDLALFDKSGTGGEFQVRATIAGGELRFGAL